MASQFRFLALTAAAFIFAIVPAGSLPPTPCPEYFRYVFDGAGRVEGLLTLPYDYSPYLDLHVNATMRGYFGESRSNMRLKMLTPPQDLYMRSTPYVRFQLQFPVQESIPRITQILLNGRLFCIGPPEPVIIPGPPITKLYSTLSFQMAAALRAAGFDLRSIPQEGNDYYYSEEHLNEN